MSRVLAIASLFLAACSRAPADRPGMVYVPAGEFMMGSAENDPDIYTWEKPHEQPQHRVRLDGYYMDLHEVTNAEFERFAPSHVRAPSSSCDDCPVTNVSWFAAQAYCAAQQPPKRLPTEAEWEKAAKGGQPEWKPQPFDDYAWSSRLTIKRAQPVARKLPNPCGLYDMLGNVREWTADWYDPGYYSQSGNAENPKGPPMGCGGWSGVGHSSCLPEGLRRRSATTIRLTSSSTSWDFAAPRTPEPTGRHWCRALDMTRRLHAYGNGRSVRVSPLALWG